MELQLQRQPPESDTLKELPPTETSEESSASKPPEEARQMPHAPLPEPPQKKTQLKKVAE